MGYAQWSADLGLETGTQGPNLKLTVGHKSKNWNFKGWGSTDFSGGWKAGISVGIKFKRSTNDVSIRGLIWKTYSHEMKRLKQNIETKENKRKQNKTCLTNCTET
jgi:hypothetical protein